LGNSPNTRLPLDGLPGPLTVVQLEITVLKCTFRDNMVISGPKTDYHLQGKWRIINYPMESYHVIKRATFNKSRPLGRADHVGRSPQYPENAIAHTATRVGKLTPQIERGESNPKWRYPPWGIKPHVKIKTLGAYQNGSPLPMCRTWTQGPGVIVRVQHSSKGKFTSWNSRISVRVQVSCVSARPIIGSLLTCFSVYSRNQLYVRLGASKLSVPY